MNIWLARRSGLAFGLSSAVKLTGAIVASTNYGAHVTVGLYNNDHAFTNVIFLALLAQRNSTDSSAALWIFMSIVARATSECTPGL